MSRPIFLSDFWIFSLSPDLVRIGETWLLWILREIWREISRKNETKQNKTPQINCWQNLEWVTGFRVKMNSQLTRSRWPGSLQCIGTHWSFLVLFWYSAHLLDTFIPISISAFSSYITMPLGKARLESNFSMPYIFYATAAQLPIN